MPVELAGVPPRSRWTAALLAALGEAGDPPLLRAVDGSQAPDLLATLALDGSPAGPKDLDAVLVDVTDPLAGVRPEPLLLEPTEVLAPGSWVAAMGDLLGEDAPDAAIVAREVVGVLTALRERPAPFLAAGATPAELDADLRQLHDELTLGLVASDDSGQLRTTVQAVHDASTSQILFYAPDARGLPDRWTALLRWLAETLDDDGQHPVEVAAVLHHHLARLHPFESANGRLARAAAHHVLHGAGIRSAGLDTAMARDRIGYWQQLATDAKRADLARAVETFAEHLLAGRRATAVGVRPRSELAARVHRWTLTAPPTFTVADVRDGVASPLDDVTAALLELTATNAVAVTPGTSGLRWRRGA